MTTLGNGGTPVVEVVVGANKVETVVKGMGDGVATSMVQVRTSCGGGCLGGKVIFSGMMSQMILPAPGKDRGLGDVIVSRDGIEVSGWMMGEGTPIDQGQWTNERNAMVRLYGSVPFGSGLSAAPSTGDAIGDTSTGRSVSGEGVVSVGVGIGGLFCETADVDKDISRCHRRQERFSSRGPSWIEYLHLANTNRHGWW
jgi:hypothetical protein